MCTFHPYSNKTIEAKGKMRLPIRPQVSSATKDLENIKMYMVDPSIPPLSIGIRR